MNLIEVLPHYKNGGEYITTYPLFCHDCEREVSKIFNLSKEFVNISICEDCVKHKVFSDWIFNNIQLKLIYSRPQAQMEGQPRHQGVIPTNVFVSKRGDTK